MKSKICYVCGKEITKRNDVGLNKKLIAKDTKIFYCLDCLAEYLEVDVDFLLEKVKEFKEQGCALFGGDDS